MFGLLRKKRKALVEPAVVPPVLQMVPVRRSNFDMAFGNGTELLQDVTYFVEKMRQELQAEIGEIPPLALQAYHANAYVSQVRALGHKGFIEDRGDDFAEMLINAQTGLASMGAVEHRDILEDFLSIVNLDPSASDDQDITEELSILDDEMAALEISSPVCAKTANWIKSWLILQVLDEDDYQAAVERGFCVKHLHDALHQYPVESVHDDLTDAQKEFAMLRSSEADQDALLPKAN